jgi:hypothetical protein
MLPTLHDRTTYGSGSLSDWPFSPPGIRSIRGGIGQIMLPVPDIFSFTTQSRVSRNHNLAVWPPYGSFYSRTSYGSPHLFSHRVPPILRLAYQAVPATRIGLDQTVAS